MSPKTINRPRPWDLAAFARIVESAGVPRAAFAPGKYDEYILADEQMKYEKPITQVKDGGEETIEYVNKQNEIDFNGLVTKWKKMY